MHQDNITEPASSPVDSPLDSPVDVHNILSKLPVLQNRGIMETINARIQKRGLIKNWIKIVGPTIAKHTVPVSIQGQKIVVLVDEPKWITALQQTEELLNKKISEFLKSDHPVKAEFRAVSSFTHLPRPSPVVEPKLTSGQAVKIENLLYVIKNNDDLKQTLKNILTKHCQHDRNFFEEH